MSNVDFDFGNVEMVRNRLNELIAMDIPRMTVGKIPEKYNYLVKLMTPEEIEEANEYFSSFCEIGYNDGADIFSNDSDLTFKWALKHGVIECVRGCGLSRQYYHYLNFGGEEHRLEFDLQKHPATWTIDDDEEEYDDYE